MFRLCNLFQTMNRQMLIINILSVKLTLLKCIYVENFQGKKNRTYKAKSTAKPSSIIMKIVKEKS